MSKLWNELVTLRLRLPRGGEGALAGDAVLRSRGGAAGAAAPTAGSALHAADVEVWQPPPAASEAAAPSELPAGADRPALWEVALQLPGKHASYALPALAQLYAERLRADGLEPADMPAGARYRPLVVRPAAIRAEWLCADDGGAVDGAGLPRPRVRQEDLPAVRLSFRLPPATFATMLLREVLRCPSDELEEWANRQRAAEPAARGSADGDADIREEGSDE